MSDNEQLTPTQPFQFGLAKLIQFVTIAALWCAAAIVRENVVLGLAYTVVTVAATWTVVGRWAVGLSPKACRRVLAAATTLLVAGGVGVTVLVENEEYFPLVWMLTALLVAFPLVMMDVGVAWGIVASIICDALALFLVCLCGWRSSEVGIDSVSAPTNAAWLGRSPRCLCCWRCPFCSASWVGVISFTATAAEMELTTSGRTASFTWGCWSLPA